MDSNMMNKHFSGTRTINTSRQFSTGRSRKWIDQWNRLLQHLLRGFCGLSIVFCANATLAKPESPTSSLTRIAFGSCVHQDHEQPIWQAVNADKPELFIFLGDNIYGDTEDMKVLANKYQKLASNPGFATLRQNSHVIATWDDHDYGANDAGAEYPQKAASRRIMLDFWGEPEDSARRTREDGIYTAYTFGKPGRRVQVILLDLRWNRSALNSVSKREYQQLKAPKNMGPYEPVTAADAVFLGEGQWQWLEQQLQQPADLRLIGSSLQLLPEFTGWESWANFPQERQRLFDLINRHQVNGVFIVSGDTHWAEFSRVDNAVGYPLWEATSSGLTEEWKQISPNRHRLGRGEHRNNYGLIEIDWAAEQPFMTVSIKSQDGYILLQNSLRLNALSYPAGRRDSL
jgi:alkaline phosphatase D